MRYQTVTLTSKGQLTLPKEYRDKLRLDKGSRLAVALKGDTLLLKKAYKVAPLAEADPIWDMLGMFEDRDRTGGVSAAPQVYAAAAEAGRGVGR